MDQFQQVFVYNYTQVDMRIPESYKEYIEWNKDDHLITYKFNANKCIKYRTILNLIKSNELTPKPSINDIIWLLCEIYKARLKAEEIGIFLNRISTDDIFLIFPNGFKNEEMKSVVFKYITFRQIHLPCVWMTHVIEETIKLMQQCYQEDELHQFQYFKEWFKKNNQSLQNIEEYITYIKQFQQSSFKINYSIPNKSTNNIQIHNEQLRSRVQYLQFEADVTQVDCNNTLKLIEMIDQCYTQLEIIIKDSNLKYSVDSLLNNLMGLLYQKSIFNCDTVYDNSITAIDLINQCLFKQRQGYQYFIVYYEISALKVTLENIIMRGITNTRNNYLFTLYLVLNKEISRLYLQQQPTLIQVQQFYNDCLNNIDNKNSNKLQRIAEGIKKPTCTSTIEELQNVMEYKYKELLKKIQDQQLLNCVTQQSGKLKQSLIQVDQWEILLTEPFAFLKINETGMEQLQVLNEKWQRHLSNNQNLFKKYDKDQIELQLNELWTSINNQEPLIQTQIQQNIPQQSQQNTTINENKHYQPQQTMVEKDIQSKCDNTQTQLSQNGQQTTYEKLKKCLEPALYEKLMQADLTEALLSNMVQRLTLPKKYLSYLGVATVFIQVVPNFKVEIDKQISTWNKLVVENPKNDIHQDLDMLNNHVKKEIDELFKPAIKEQFVQLK